jgi:hypothetical protein
MSAYTERIFLEHVSKAKRPPRRADDEVELTESEARHGLKNAVKVLSRAAIPASRNKKLEPEERAFFLRQGDLLASSAANLIALLNWAPPISGFSDWVWAGGCPDPAVRAERLRDLHRVIGAAAVIARERLTRLATGRLAREGRSRKRQDRDRVLREEALPYRLKYPLEKAPEIARKAQPKLNARLRRERKRPLKRATIERRLRLNWDLIIPPER